LTVLKVQAVADGDVGGKVAIRCGDAFGGPRGVGDRNDETRAAFEAHRRCPAGKFSGSNFGAWKVLQQRDLDVEFGRNGARVANHFGVLVGRAVREV